MCKISVIVSLLCFFCVNSIALDIQQTYTLSMQNSNKVKASNSGRQAEMSDAKMATRSWLPDIEAQGFFSRGDFHDSGVNTRSAFDGVNIIARQTIFNYAKIVEATGAKYVRDLANDNFQLTKEVEIQRAVRAYFDVLLSKRLLHLADLKKRMLKTGLYQVRVAKDLNLKTPDQVEFIQSDYEDAIAEDLKARTAYSDAIAVLENLVHRRVQFIRPLKQDIVLKVQPPPPLSVWLLRARKHNLAIRMLQLSAVIAQKQVEMEFGKRLPQVSAIGSYNVLHNKGVMAYDGIVYGVTSTEANHLHGYSVGLEASVPLFTGGVITVRQDAAEQKRQQVIYKLAEAQSLLALKTRTDYLLLQTDHAKVKAERSSVHASSIAYHLTQAELKEHRKTELDLLKAQAKLGLAQQKYQEAVFDYLKRYVDLHADAGELNAAVIYEINQYVDPHRRIAISQFDRYPIGSS